MHPSIKPALVALVAPLAALVALVACAAPSPAPAPAEPKSDNDKSEREEDESEPQDKAASDRPAAPADAGADAVAPGLPSTPNTCETAREFGSVFGDSAGSPASTEGRCGEWVRVRVLEQDDGWFGTPVKLKASLTPPPGTTFDLAAFVNVDRDQTECTTPTGNLQQNGGAIEIDLGWGEGFVANGADDGRTLILQVRSPSGQCAAQPWKLSVTRME